MITSDKGNKAGHGLKLNIPLTNMVKDVGVIQLQEFHSFHLHPYTGSRFDLMAFPQKRCMGLTSLIQADLPTKNFWFNTRQQSGGFLSE